MILHGRALVCSGNLDPSRSGVWSGVSLYDMTVRGKCLWSEWKGGNNLGWYARVFMHMDSLFRNQRRLGGYIWGGRRARVGFEPTAHAFACDAQTLHSTIRTDGKTYVAIHHAVYVLELEVVLAMGAELSAWKNWDPRFLWCIWNILYDVQTIKSNQSTRRVPFQTEWHEVPHSRGNCRRSWRCQSQQLRDFQGLL